MAMTSSGIAISANGSNGLILQQTASGPSIQPSLPAGIQSFDDVSIDAENESLVFALSTTSRRVCSFTISGGDLTLVNCVGQGDNFGVSPFCGVSAFDSTLIISGGTVGLTIYQYDTGSGVISDTPSVLNDRGLGAIGHPDVVLINSGLAALSTDFNGTPRFGTLIASIQGSNVNNEQEFRVQNSLGFNLLIAPANFPLVNVIYEARYMYTANGPMQVQDILSDGRVDILSGTPTEFSAVTVAVNTARKIVVFGGVTTSGGSLILFYDLSVDPRNPSLVGSVPIAGQRITSIASGGDVAAYTTTVSLTDIQFVPLLVPSLSCVENGTDEFLLELNPNNGNPVVINCNELAIWENASRICTRRVDYSGIYRPPQDICLATCNSCSTCYQNGRSRFFLRLGNDGAVRLRTCNWLMQRSLEQKRRICGRTGSNGGYGPAIRHCPVVCDVGSCE